MIESLTEREKEALRLLYQRYSYKEIGRRLGGISHHSVYDRITSAKRRLGVDDAMEAARLLHVAEGKSAPDIVGPAAVGVGEIADSGLKSPQRPLPWPFPTDERPLNDTSFSTKMTQVVVIASLMMASAALYLIAVGQLVVTR